MLGAEYAIGYVISRGCGMYGSECEECQGEGQVLLSKTRN